MRILIVSPFIPYPLISGDTLRLYNLISRISKLHQVWIVALTDSPDLQDVNEGRSHLKLFCSGVEVIPRRRLHPFQHMPGLIRFALSGKPLELWFEYYEELIDKIKYLTTTIEFDIVQIEHSYMAQYLNTIPKNSQTKSILDFHNITSLQYQRISRVAHNNVTKIRTLLYSIMMRNWEPHIAERFDRCMTVSNEDRYLLKQLNPKLKVDVIPNGVDTFLYRPLPQEKNLHSLLFVGTMRYAANSDAAIFFCQKVLPLIRRELGLIEMWFVGTDPSPEVLQLSGNGVHVTGRVNDVLPYYRRSSVCVVPLRAGGGSRLKILEAMALGRPVVSTKIGCEGLDVIDGTHILIADDPEEFAIKTVLLLNDQDLYQHIVFNARQLVVEKYDWEVIARKLSSIYTELQDELE